MKSLLIAISILLSFAVRSQTIKGTVRDNKASLAGATVSLLTINDSLVKLELTGANGSFTFNNIPAGMYKVTATYVGYATAASAAFTLDSVVVVPGFVLSKASKELSAVVVTSKKPMIQVRSDKTIVNVEGSINATGNTVLELLRKSPGVALDKDDNISMSGKNGVRVYIDGRPTALSGQDLSAYLASIQSANVEAIELITNPSAKYDAAGNAGIINIRLKKNNAFGTNGSLNAGLNIGTNARYNNGISLNHRNAKVNVFGNYNYSGGKNSYNIGIYRSAADTLFDQSGGIRERINTRQFKTGADYFINKNNTIGISMNGNISSPTIYNSSRVVIAPIATGVTNRILVADNVLEQKRSGMAFNLNYTFQNTGERNLTVNADHAFYHLRGDQMQPNDYFDASGTNKLYRVAYRMISPTDITINSVNGDYEQGFGGGKLGMGAKLASIKTDNDFQRYTVTDTSKQLDKDRSNRFRYNETIGAGYVNYNKAMKGVVIQAGVRLENTLSKGKSTGLKNTTAGYTPYDSSFNRSYLDVFPSAAITFNKNIKRQWTLSYSRRIDRPAYQELNPFEFKVDEYTSQMGSVNLRPQYTNSMGITYIHNQKLTGSLNYSHIKDLFIQLMDTVDKSKAFITNANLGKQDVVNLSISYPYQYKSYSLIANTTANYKRLKANFGEGRTIDLGVTGFTFLAQNSLKFSNTWTAELTGFYNSPTIYGSNLKSKSMWSVDAGVQKQLFNNKANVKLAVSDAFNSLRFEGSSFFAGQEATFTRKAESRQVKMSFAWRFGSNTVKAARQRKAGAEDEMKRVQ